MALTNGITLVNKIKTIADAIRRRTPNNTGNLTIDQMVNEIDNEWKIKCYVKGFNYGGGSIGYIDNNFGIILSYTTDSKIVLTARSNNVSYENIQWELSAPDNSISMINTDFSGNASLVGKEGILQSCIISGINKPCTIYVDAHDKNVWNNYVNLKVSITYI